ncbi:MAG: hypothetical protein KGS00_02315 [Alphaproteobacteria bacterium]|nr:hypothetical protein [Alphaproteobacteria bacterium]
MVKLRTSLAVVLSLASFLISGCAYGPTPYQPGERQGYSDVRLEANRFRVSFRGNSLTDRETVELYLLVRAAELTVENGFDTFSIVERETDRQTRLASISTGFDGRFSYVYFHPRFGWVAAHDPFWSSAQIDQVTRFEATAEIVMSKGPKGEDINAFDARDVLSNLTSRVVRPAE